MNIEATGLLTENARVAGVRYRAADGSTGELRADLTVACDGRRSLQRDSAGLHARSFGVPMDVWWFRLPRYEEDPVGVAARFGAGCGMILVDRVTSSVPT